MMKSSFNKDDLKDKDVPQINRLLELCSAGPVQPYLIELLDNHCTVTDSGLQAHLTSLFSIIF